MLRTVSSLLISIALIGLAFFGVSKFIVWYPTLNKFIFYLLAIFFAWSVRFLPSRIQAIKSTLKLNNATGYSTLTKVRVSIQFLSLAACWWWFIKSIIANRSLYQDGRIVGFLCLIAFIIVTTLSLIASFLTPDTNSKDVPI